MQWARQDERRQITRTGLVHTLIYRGIEGGKLLFDHETNAPNDSYSLTSGRVSVLYRPGTPLAVAGLRLVAERADSDSLAYRILGEAP